MKVHFSDWNNVLADAKSIAGNCDPMDADALVLFNDVRGSFKEITETAHKFTDKKVYVMQHGRAATRDYDEPNSFPLLADKFLAWGQADFDRMSRLGYADKTVIVGCPLLSQIQPKQPHEGKYVLFIPINTDHEEAANLQVYYRLLQMKYGSAIRRLESLKPSLETEWKVKGKFPVPFHEINDINVLAKVLPRHDRQLYHGDTFVSSPEDPGHVRFLFELLSNVDCVVTLDESTTEILAMAADVPVVCVDAYKWAKFGGSEAYSKVELIRSDAAHHATLENLEETVLRVLENPSEKAAERKAVVNYELGVSAGAPVMNILNAIGYQK